MNPKISVVIPTHNKSAQLQMMLDPLLNQSLPPNDYELIVVDNGSTDDTPEIIEHLSQQHFNVRYLREPRPGPAAARNAGVSAARGEYVLFIDDDIVVLPDHLQRHLDYHTANPNCVVIGYIRDESPIHPNFLRLYFADRQTLGNTTVLDGKQFPVMPKMATGNVSIPRDVLESVCFTQDGQRRYFDEALRMCEDTDMGYRLKAQGMHFVAGADAVCVHHHLRSWRDIVRRTYFTGYYMYHLYHKHKHLKPQAKYVITSRLVNFFLLVTALAVLPIGYVVQKGTPWLMFKAIGGVLIAISNMGYQKAMQESISG
jgi:glycosyltransferase involved in cell wall biosynthesis